MIPHQSFLLLWQFHELSHRLHWQSYRISFRLLQLLKCFNFVTYQNYQYCEANSTFTHSKDYEILKKENERLGIFKEFMEFLLRIKENYSNSIETIKCLKHTITLKRFLWKWSFTPTYYSPAIFPSSSYRIFPSRSIKLKSFMKIPLTFLLFIVSRISSWVNVLILLSVTSVYAPCKYSDHLSFLKLLFSFCYRENIEKWTLLKILSKTDIHQDMFKSKK